MPDGKSAGTYRGVCGVAENICLCAIEESEIDSDYNFIFFRTNKAKMEGFCTNKLRRIDIAIATRDFYRSGLSVLFHEIGHSLGLNHREAINYSYEVLYGMSKKKNMHLDLSQMNAAAINNIIKSYDLQVVIEQPVCLSITTNPRGRMFDVVGSYEEVVPYLDLRPDGKITTIEHELITEQTIIKEGTDFPCRVKFKAL